jgi:flagellar basal-body rod protein FlgC
MSDIYDIASSGMAAERVQMDIIAQNLANAGMPRADGSVFRAKTAVFEQAEPFAASLADALDAPLPDGFASSDAFVEAPSQPAGVQVADIIESKDAPQYRFDPGNPFAARSGAHKGFIALPEVDAIQEMVALVSAGREYDANVSMLTAAKQMDIEAADIDRLS